MAVTGRLYGQILESTWGKLVDWDNDVIKVMLTTSAYTPNQDTHDFKDDITNEVTGTGYTATGETLASKTVTTSAYTGGTNVFALDAADTTWTTSTITARTAVIYNSSPATDGARMLICYQQSDADISTTAGTFTIQWHADGIVKMTVS